MSSQDAANVSRTASAFKTSTSTLASTLTYAVPHLAGAIDILAVLQPDGSVKTSPFYVRFGKYSGFREKHRRVSISVNGIPQSYAMQVGRTGEAYFVEEVEQPLAEGEGVDDAVLGGIDSPPQGYSDDDEGESTSLPPVPSALGRGGTPYASPLRHGEVKRSASEPSLSTLDGTKGEERGHSEAQPSQGLPLPHGSQGRPPLPKAKPPSHRPLRFSDSEVNEKAALEAVAAAEVAAGKVEHGRPIELAAARAVATVDSTAGEEHARPPHPTHQQQVNDEQIHGQPHEDGSVKSSDKEDKQIMSNGALAPPAAQADGPSNNGPDASDASVGHKPPSPAGKSSPPQPQLSAPGTGVPPRVLSHALADLVAASPQAMSPTAGLAGEGPSLGQTTASGSGPAPPLELSLCWGLLRPGMSPEEVSAAFAAHRVGAEAFAQAHAEVLSDPRLACRLGGSVFAFASAQLLVIASLAYGPEAAAAMNEPTHFVSYPLKAGVPEGSTSSAGEAPRGTSWRDWLSFGWRSSGTKDEEHLQAQSSSENLDARGAQNAGDRLQGSQLFRSSTGGSRGSDSVPPEQEAALLAAAAGGQASHVQVTEVGGVRRSSTGERSVVLRKRGFVPAAEHLPELGAALKTGKNDIEFTFGRHKLRAYVYLVAWDCRLIISDVDGTITKSDVMGHFGQLLGFDWTHSGVAGLFSAVASNGYQLLYLSSRSIAQASITRDYLHSLKQGRAAMPHGPVIISPDGLFPSLYREVVLRKPQEFKIRCLEDIRSLFPPEWNPFMAGFGNRDTDVESYLAVGVPASRIFIINPKGELRKPSTAVSTSSLRTLSALTALVDALFPAVPASQGVPLPTSTLTVGHLPGAGTTPGGSPRLAGSVTGSESDAWGEGGSFNGGVSVFGAGMEGGAPHQRRGREDTPARDEFNSFNYWRIQTSYVVDDEEDLFEDALGGPDGDGDGGGVIENDGKAGSNGAEGGDGSSNMKAA